MDDLGHWGHWIIPNVMISLFEEAPYMKEARSPGLGMPGEDAQTGQAYVRDIAFSEAEVFGLRLDVDLLLLLMMMMMMMILLLLILLWLW